MPSELRIGDQAPDFRCQVIGEKYPNGHTISLSDLRGSTAILYFYPKDDTPGCTVQACSLRDAWGEVSTKASVFGVSVDSAMSHQKFIKKYQLPFPLLVDSNQEVVKAYGVWIEKNMYGRKYMGTERSTFVIDGRGRISSILRRVKPDQHVAMLLAALSTVAG